MISSIKKKKTYFPPSLFFLVHEEAAQVFCGGDRVVWERRNVRLLKSGPCENRDGESTKKYSRAAGMAPGEVFTNRAFSSERQCAETLFFSPDAELFRAQRVIVPRLTQLSFAR